MKGLFFAVLVSVVGAFAILLWQSRGGPVHSFPFQKTASKEAYGAAVLPSASRPAPKSAHLGKAVGSVSEAGTGATPPCQLEECTPSTTTARPPFPATHPPFPAANQIALGTGADAVTGAYGNPSAWAVTSAEGHMVETLVYTQERGRSATVIRIVDGRVSAVYTKVPPASPRGSLFRNFGLQN